jgi:hypothetical protein
MGLFSTVIHLRQVDRDSTVKALDQALRQHNFHRKETLSILRDGPGCLPDHDSATENGPYYLVSGETGSWLTVIEAHFAVDGAPPSQDLCLALSTILGCYALLLVVLDDDLFLYNLDRSGESLDGYNSCPQYFEQERLREADIQGQRHTPNAFAPLLPAGVSLDQLARLLDRGWWDAHDCGHLDKDGVETGEGSGFAFESERMTQFGSLLRLHGKDGRYPYAAWAQDPDTNWSSFIALRYAAQ